MQNEQQLRNKSVPYEIQQKSDENCCEDAANCNKPSSQENNNYSLNLSAAQPSNETSCKELLDYPSQKIVECCDNQNARYSTSQEPQKLDYSLSNRPNNNQHEIVHKVGPESMIIREEGGDSVQVNIRQLSECLGNIEKRLSNMDTKMERIVTNMRELSDVVDHDIMKRDQEAERSNHDLSEREKITDRFKNEMTPSRNCRQFTSSEPCCSKDCRQITPSEKITDKFKKGDPS
ncbi:MAG: hypothetical protein GY816_02830, partial [Cytophagales bacterium]|nr:hypothetical protein [Cytophagales bacterium]